MEKSKNRQAWIGNTPFPPDKKEVMVIWPHMEETFLYGFDRFQDENKVYVSTDKVTMGDWTLPPGMTYYEPAGYHLFGDEIYYVKRGRAVALNPETGETFRLEKGDALLIPQKTRHQVFNFDEEPFTALFTVAPKIWAEEGMGTVIPQVEAPRILSSPYVKQERATGDVQRLPIPGCTPGLDAIGQWPAEGKKLRENKQLVHITPKEHLPMILGEERPVLMNFIVSNDYLNLALMTLPTGAYSQQLEHKGDVAICVLQGDLTVRPVDTEADDADATYKCFNIPQGKKCVIPEGTKYQYINFSDKVVEAFVAIAPGL